MPRLARTVVVLSILVAPALVRGAVPSAGTVTPSFDRSVRDTLQVLDSARAEIAVGRHWHAARLLAPLAAGDRLDREGRLLYARAEAGYRNWGGVTRVLADGSFLDDGDDEHGEGWRLLARAREAGGDWTGAAEAYGRALEASGADPSPEAAAAVLRGRRARALWHAGRRVDALTTLDAVGHEDARAWLALEFLGEAVEAGDTATVQALLPRITASPEPAGRAWEAEARARWQAGDTAGSVAVYREILSRDTAGVRLAQAWLALGRAARAAGDTAAARSAFLEALAAAPRSGAQGPAAAGLVDLGGLTTDETLRVARILDRIGDGRRALAAYDRYVLSSEAEGSEPDAAARVERARLMSTVAERQEAAIREFRTLSTHPESAVGARALALWAGLRRRQGRSGDEATLRRWLVERYPETAAALDVVFFQGDGAHDRGDLARALEAYARVVEMAPALDRAGLSRMRMGQILLHEGRPDEALSVFEGYLDDFPQGRRWEEASYWAARIRLARGDAEGAMRLLDRLHADEPFSYYTVLTADLLERPFVVDTLPAGPDGDGPAWMAEALDELTLYESLGLSGALTHHTGELVRRARDDADPTALYALAEGLNERGRSFDGINLGWEVRRTGEDWNLRLLRIVYPFPYRDMVVREAAEWGVNPFLLAALIRQESAWVSDIVSSAGAIGLMQVMPATGRGLARRVGLEDFTPASLESPEVNLHLGARFLVDVLERYGPDLPLVLSAYNAGPTRAERWRSFPEAGDPLRLTERIPFGETRGYVKNVTRNLRLYEALYGSVHLVR